MIAYLDQSRNSENTSLPPECPWISWVHVEGQPLPENAIVVNDEDYSLLYASCESLILKEKDRIARNLTFNFILVYYFNLLTAVKAKMENIMKSPVKKAPAKKTMAKKVATKAVAKKAIVKKAIAKKK